MKKRQRLSDENTFLLYQVDPSLYKLNRTRLFKAYTGNTGCLVFKGGDAEERFSSDHEKVSFKGHQSYSYR